MSYLKVFYANATAYLGIGAATRNHMYVLTSDPKQWTFIL